MKGKYLITTDNWFIAPDGKLYRSIWGEVEIIEDSFLGIKTNSKSTNWYAKIGSEENHVIVAGCQIHYACKSNNKPNICKVLDYSADASGHSEYERPTQIYIAE
jgi:hypothetical protein